MNAELLLAHYDKISEAPDAIARLRRFILDLAVRGKLLPQDPTDEPASELLKRLLLERRKAWEFADGKTSKNYVSPEHEDGRFELPRIWTWASALEICKCIESGSTPAATEMFEGSGEIPYIKVYNLTFTGKLDFGTRPTFISRDTHQLKLRRSKVIPNDVLMNIVGPPLGKVSIVPNLYPEWNTNQAVVLFRTMEGLLPEYLSICLRSVAVLQWILKLAQQTVGQVNISVSKSRRLPIPLPPLAEQHRIVAKVDELMGLCDRLEEARTEREAVRDRLAAASFARLQAPDADNFRASARFAVKALPALTTRPDQVKALRQTILNLAVRGKLVHQDPNDGPAEDLLRAISKRRQELVLEGKVRAAKAANPKLSGRLFALPSGWVWTYANDVWDFENGDRSKNYPSKDQLVESGIPFVNAGHLVNGSVSLVGMNYITQEKFNQLGGGKLRLGDQLYCLRGSLGKHAQYLHNGSAAIASSLVILRPIEPELVPYLVIYLDSDVAMSMLKKFDNGTAQPNLSSANLRLYEIPLPPLAEQRRIVAKVHGLMEFCDRLEAHLNCAEDNRGRLLNSLLAEAFGPAEFPEVETAK